MKKEENDIYDELFIDDVKVIIAKARRKLAETDCECGHKHRQHDHVIGGCVEKAPNGRNRCECLEFKGKKTLIEFIIEIAKENEKERILSVIKNE